jgi:TolA-binding protein
MRRSFYLASLSSLALLTACVPQSFEQRVKRLESSVNDLRSLQAEQRGQIEDLQRSLRNLTGKTEELEYSTNQKYGTDLDTLKQDLSTLKRRVPPPANVPVQPLEEDEALADRGGFSYLSDALLKLRAGNYTDAMPQLQQAQAMMPTDYQAQVLFWQGVTYDGLGEYKNSLVTYNELVSKFARSRRAPLALIRQASVFEKLGDGKAAQFALQKLINDYPDSPEALMMKSRVSSSAASQSASKKAAPIVEKNKKKR